jgi:hypothetical protein
MPSTRTALRRAAVGALLMGALAGCEQTELVSPPRNLVNRTLFVSYVALGNKIGRAHV